jgi:hypothetical protein
MTIFIINILLSTLVIMSLTAFTFAVRGYLNGEEENVSIDKIVSIVSCILFLSIIAFLINS